MSRHASSAPLAAASLSVARLPLALALLLAFAFPASLRAQILRLGPFDIFSSVHTEIAYDSNVEDSYPDELEEGLKNEDFYVLGKLSANTAAALRPNARVTLSGGFGYQKYFERDDMDSPLYNAAATLNVVLPPMFTLNANASVAYTSDSADEEGVTRNDVYYPGGKRRDPELTVDLGTALQWHWRQLRAEGRVTWAREAYDNEASKEGDNDETTYFAAAYWDVFTWGSVYYSWERTETIHPNIDGEDETEVKKNFGLSGAIPLSWIPHPHFTYSIGIESEESDTDSEKDATWEPTHTITAEDSFQINKSLRLSGSATWERAIYDDEITFEYNISLAHTWGSHITQTLNFTQEPKRTFASNSDTKTTTYGYDLGIRDFFLRGLSAGFNASYEISEPLETDDPEIEYTTTLSASIAHSKQFSKRLTRTLSYTYTWEHSNFHEDDAQVKHLVVYGYDYVF